MKRETKAKCHRQTAFRAAGNRERGRDAQGSPTQQNDPEKKGVTARTETVFGWVHAQTPGSIRARALRQERLSLLEN